MQLVFGVHPRYGRTWQYNLYADKAFLPQPKIDERTKEN